MRALRSPGSEEQKLEQRPAVEASHLGSTAMGLHQGSRIAWIRDVPGLIHHFEMVVRPVSIARSVTE